MKTFSLRLVAPTAVFLATAALAQAHPGHDGHNFTWDFTHLVDHPDTTILFIGVLGAVAWGVWKIFTAAPDAPTGLPVQGDEERRAR